MSTCNHKSSRTRATALALALSLGLVLPAFAQDGAYKVGPGDTLSVVAYGNPALTGLYPVDDSGTIGYPILGQVAVAGLTAAQIGESLTGALMEHVAGLTATVSVNSYAPVFVLGDVSTPGSYQYRPGMIALELLALGGGVSKPNESAENFGLQFISTHQQYQDLSLEIFAQQVKRARIQSERDGVPFAYSLPENTNPADRNERQAIIDAEANIMAVRARTAAAEDDGLSAQETSFKVEISTIEQGISLQSAEIASLEEDVATSQSLVDRKLATDASLRVLERNLSATRRDALELQSARARAEQSLLDIGLRRTVLVNTRQNEAASDLRDLEFEITRDTASLKSLMDSMSQLATLDADASRHMAPRTTYTITRLVDGQHTQIAASEMSEMLPGDILQAATVLAVQSETDTANLN